MRSVQWISVIILCSLLLLLLPVVSADEDSVYTGVMPTKYRLLLMMMKGEQGLNTTPPASPVPADSVAEAPVPSSDPVSSHRAVRMEPDASVTQIPPAGTSVSSANQGLGRGFVQTNFDVSFLSQGQMVDNRERLTARGLFDVHVVHEFN